MARFRTSQYTLVPRWLIGGDGERVNYSLGLLVDASAERLKQGLQARYPEHAPDDALAHIGRDRKITRGIEETSESYRQRLLPWLDDHSTRGGPYALLKQFGIYLDNYPGGPFEIALLYRNGTLFIRDKDTKEVSLSIIPFDPDDDPERWARWWLIIPWPDGTIGPDGIWSDPGDWDDGGYWDSNLEGSIVQQLRIVPSEWNAAHCNGKIVLLGGDPPPELWDYPPGVWSDPGTWGEDPPPVAVIGV